MFEAFNHLSMLKYRQWGCQIECLFPFCFFETAFIPMELLGSILGDLREKRSFRLEKSYKTIPDGPDTFEKFETCASNSAGREACQTFVRKDNNIV